MVVIGSLDGRWFGAAVQHSENHRFVRVVVDETDNHLVADFRTEKSAPVFSCIKRSNSCPDAFRVFVDHRAFDAYAVFAVGVRFELCHNGNLQSVNGAKQPGSGQIVDFIGVGKPLRIDSKLGIDGPLPFGDFVAHRRNVDFAVETVAHTFEPERRVWFAGRYALKPHPAAGFRQLVEQSLGICPIFHRLIAQRTAKFKFEVFEANNRRQIVGCHVAVERQVRAGSFLFNQFLIGVAPGIRTHFAELVSRIHLGIEIEQGSAKSNCFYLGLSCVGRFDGYFSVVNHHHFAVCLRPCDQKIPVGAVVLNQFLVLKRGCFHVGCYAIRSDDFFERVAVFAVEEIFAFSPGSQFHGFVFAFNRQQRIARSYFQAVFHDDSLENGFFVGMVTGINFEHFAGQKLLATAQRKVLAGRIAVGKNQSGRGNPVDLLFNTDVHDLHRSRKLGSVDPDFESNQIG